jgi:hypothetical protein
VESVYCALWTDSLYKADYVQSWKVKDSLHYYKNALRQHSGVSGLIWIENWLYLTLPIFLYTVTERGKKKKKIFVTFLVDYTSCKHWIWQGFVLFDVVYIKHKIWNYSHVGIHIVVLQFSLSKKDRQCNYNVTLWRVRVTILVWKHNKTFCVFCWCYRSLLIT